MKIATGQISRSLRLEDGKEEYVKDPEPEERLRRVVEAAKQPDERRSHHRQVHVHRNALQCIVSEREAVKSTSNAKDMLQED